ncbi:PREDICTED: uncharacterized protein LOC109189720 [Ipomoea nil]|uniref:uncharacterized protein LOC109189720 n=1 Tax=Ipomoea nil TaxID=35883 RepID=UPI000901A3F9|nr:PREDICTED: uncharacterized protein LOC109189720 [Ipomoea nil]
MSVSCSIYLETIMDKKNDSAVPIIGWYVALASGLCSIAMVCNLLTKFFSLNATWLTLLAVATKLTGDLTTPMSPWDNVSKCSSTIFLTLAMGNSFISLGSMNDTYILTNLTALTILVATVIVDLCIQLQTHVLDSSLSMQIIFQIILLFCMFITTVCSALAVPAIKKHSESIYQKLAAASDEKQGRPTVEELRLSITKYWVMAASGSPRFLMKSKRVPNLLSGELPNCWKLPVVTLTSIAIAIPNIASEHIDWLVSSVNAGLRYASLIDAMDEKCGLKSIKHAADVVWVGVELRRNENRIIVENPLYWPVHVFAANSMYSITRTILLYYEDGEFQAEELFRKLICMIADILAACFTNLPHLIYTKCISSSIEERLESVRDAAIIFGETEEILKLFEEDGLSNKQLATVSSSATSNGASSVESNEHVVVQMQA